MPEPLKIRVCPQDIGYPDITIPETLRGPLEAARRLDTPAAWAALHAACLSHQFPKPSFSPAWEADYAALAWLTRCAVQFGRLAAMRRKFAALVPSRFDCDTPDGASF